MKAVGEPAQPEERREWVVVLKEDSSDVEVDEVCSESGKGHLDGEECLGGHPTEGGVPFAEVTTTDAELEALLAMHSGRVEFVEADMPLHVVPEQPGDEGESSLLQSGGRYPWGITRTRADLSRGEGRGVHVYVHDTGVRVDHQEFGERAIPTLDMTSGRMRVCSAGDARCAADRQGHGTHCAVTVGGETMGVASGVTIHGVKVLSDEGSGYSSWGLTAMDWVIKTGSARRSAA